MVKNYEFQFRVRFSEANSGEREVTANAREKRIGAELLLTVLFSTINVE